MHLFIAINFDDTTRSQLLSLRDELQGKSKCGNFTIPENLHLTLVFLGECNTTQTITIKSVMDSVAAEPFDITVDRIGRFRRSGGDIWWAGMQESSALAALQKSLTDKLIAKGFILEKRKYKPHITLGREIVTHARPQKIEPFGETVSGIELMKSERIKGILTYTAIHSRGFVCDE